MSASSGTSSPSTPQRALTTMVAPSPLVAEGERGVGDVDAVPALGRRRRCGRRSPRRGRRRPGGPLLQPAAAEEGGSGEERGWTERRRRIGGGRDASIDSSVPGAMRRRGPVVIARRRAGSGGGGRKPCPAVVVPAAAAASRKKRTRKSPATKPAEVREEGDPAAPALRPRAPSPFQRFTTKNSRITTHAGSSRKMPEEEPEQAGSG